MAAAVTLTLDAYPNGVTNDQRYIHLWGEAAFAADPATYVTGGSALNWASLLSSPDGVQLPISTQDIAAPVDVDFKSESASGWVYGWNKSANKIQILAASGGTAGTEAPFEEMTTGTAIPAGVSGDTIRFHAVFNRMRG